MNAIGHRRQLQRYLREDHLLQERAAADRDAVEAQRSKQRRGLYAGLGGGASNAARPNPKSASASAGMTSKKKASMTGTSESQPQMEQNSLLSRLSSLDEQRGGRGLARGDSQFTGGGDGALPARHADAWHAPWRTTADAALVNGAGPGERVEAHAPAMTPRDGILLVGNDGSQMRIW